jgi:hypothetical protein
LRAFALPNVQLSKRAKSDRLDIYSGTEVRCGRYPAGAYIAGFGGFSAHRAHAAALRLGYRRFRFQAALKSHGPRKVAENGA